MRESISSLIPFYLNQTLSPEEMKAVETALLEDADARQELFLWMGVRQHLNALGEAYAAASPPADPWVMRSKMKKRTTLYIPLKRASARYLRIPAWVWQPAAVAIVLLQFAAIALLVAGARLEKSAALHTLSAPAAVAAVPEAAYNVVFLPESSEEQIRALLLRYRAQFIEGPNRVGLYRIRFAALNAGQAEAFRREPIVQFMEKSL